MTVTASGKHNESVTFTLMDPERRLYQISALVNDNGRLVEWIVSPQGWVLTLAHGQDAHLVQNEVLGSAWTAPPEGKFGQVHVDPVPWNGQTDPAYPMEFLFRFTRV
ncbi:hypothetical protein EDD16DRAFT_1703350 [Pisolithus croceorrhizus]|nr:hypothetical protein EDD16DRAFT_1703350 [Pisolithus croceorrhizus]KAI6161895.1 hypothetical protein EDD17DRAFT_1758452 [Pisolithus thermaeus]